jgi:methyl-accepting chemotaxis protein
MGGNGSMTTSERAQRLRIDTRLAILDDISALNKQRKAAIQAGQGNEADRIQDIIEDLNDRLDDLSMLSLEALDKSDAVRNAIRDLRTATDQLEDEADNITDVASALQKGAEIAQQSSGIITQLRNLSPIG